MSAPPHSCDAFLARFLDAASALAEALPDKGGDPERLREEAADRLLAGFFLRFARAASCGLQPELARLAPCAGDAPESSAAGAAESLLDALLNGYRLQLTEPRPDQDALAGGALAPDILAAAHALTRAGRQDAGVFYTPVGEVRLMCREALRARMAHALGVADDDPELLGILYGQGSPDLPAERAALLFRELARLRVCDPAAGCGALLVGMAHELSRLLTSLGRLVLPEDRNRLLEEGLPDPLSPTSIRRHIAASTLFGLDLDAGALNVTRQRLFLFTLAAGGEQVPDVRLLEALRAHLQEGDGLEPPGQTSGSQGHDPLPTKIAGSAPTRSPWLDRLPEIFAPPGGGFDIVLSNPPYVRQERLDARRKSDAPRACQALLPTEFRFDGKSDLYAYFFHLGLGLLREGGALCVIASNSWLDVGFGQALRRLLLRHSRILSITESARKGTFTDARIHPAILLARRCIPAADEPEPVRFIRMHHALGEPRSLDEMTLLAGTRRFLSTPAFRVVPVPQAVLAAEAVADRMGVNWGGRYLRAPDLFFEMLEACGTRLCRLDALASVRFGIKTGANDFFYLESIPGGAPSPAGASDDLGVFRNGMGEERFLERRFLRRALRSPRELRTPELLPEDAASFLLTCPEEPEALAGTRAADYVREGESRWGIHRRPSVRGRARWYSLPLIAPPPVIHPLIAFERACAAINPRGILCDANLVGIYPHEGVDPALLAACLVSSLGVMMRELVGIANLGQGALKTNPAYLARMLVPDLRAASSRELAALGSAFQAARQAAFPSLLDGEPDPVWRALDDAVLALLGPGAPDGARLRAAACELVSARLAKARA
ncbi:MAG TPA: Eco57I restriction-modification methylase domain-containing protein [Armatimonadota bacterium]|jgi:hypothetical protein|nr:Eco57I restriction-modification methylase domain-containing protein [Armatimonadota bacterium]